MQTRRESVAETRARYLDSLAEDTVDAALDALQAYQDAALRLRQAEGEVLWVSLGHAIGEVADSADPDEDAVREQGESFLDWVTETSPFETVPDRESVLLEVARRSPTLPETHAAYVRGMFDLDEAAIADLRQRDRSRLEQAGWQQAAPVEAAIVREPCPACETDLLLEVAPEAEVTLSTTFEGSTGGRRERCPGCGRPIFVQTDG